jgi:hypothetical protein
VGGAEELQARGKRRRGGRDEGPSNPTVNFHGEQRSNATHASTTDPDAQLARRGPGHEAKLAFHGHVLMDNRHGLAAAARVTRTSGTADWRPPSTTWCGCSDCSWPVASLDVA